MLGIGMQEMMIIALAALLIFGPGKLPEVMGQAGKLYRDFRSMTSELTGEFEKTVAEAKEMGNQITGELGPMQSQVDSITKSVQRDLGTGSKSSRSTTGKKTTSSNKTGSTAKKSTTSSKSTSSPSNKTNSTSSSTRSNGSKTTKTTSSSTDKAKKAATVPVATKDEPDIDFSLFEVTAPDRTRRARKATPSVITDPTPRNIFASNDSDTGSDVPTSLDTFVNDPIARARQRRRNAGYANRSA